MEDDNPEDLYSSQEVAEESKDMPPLEVVDLTAETCQEYSKNSALFAQFLLSSLTYVSLSYFVHLHCANIHTPLCFFYP